MDELDRMFRRLVDVVRADYPSLIDRPIEVGELYQSVLPYRHHRRELGLDTNQDYELAMMRLLSGARGYVRGDPRMQERLRQELDAKNPDTALFRGFATTTVTLDPDAVRRVTGAGGALEDSLRDEPLQPRPAGERLVADRPSPVADQPVAQRVADDRAPEHRSPPRPIGPPASSPDAETIVFRRSPAAVPPISMAPPPPAPGMSAGAPSVSASPPTAPASAPASGRPSEAIELRSNERITLRPGGEVVSSLGEPASVSSAAAAAAAAPAAAPPTASSSASPTPLPSVGPPPRPQSSSSSSSEAGPRSAGSSSSAGAASAFSAAPPPAAPASTTSSPRATMATPQRGPNTVVASGDCRYCGGVLPDGRRITFCPHCGQNLTIQHCPACSTELELGWKFCTTCGRSVGETAAAAKA